MSDSVTNFDWAIILVYLAGVVGIGVAAGFLRRRGGEGSHYFLAGNTLTWPIIGLAMFAANISTVHLVSLAETAYKYGLVFGNFEWMAGFTLILLSLFFAPLYLRSRVPTLPDYLERRYQPPLPRLPGVRLALLGDRDSHRRGALHGGLGAARDSEPRPAGHHPGHRRADVLHHRAGRADGHLHHARRPARRGVDGEHPDGAAAGRGGLHHGGGLCEDRRLVGAGADAGDPSAPDGRGRKAFPQRPANFLNMARGASDPSGLPWYSILLGYPVLGIWYWCCDQTIVQRVLAARDEKQARLGPLFCAFIKILPVFIFVLPGRDLRGAGAAGRCSTARPRRRPPTPTPSCSCSCCRWG